MHELKIDFNQELLDSFEEIVSWRRYLHMNPEISFQEVETPRFIAEKLRSFGIEVHENIGGNGVVGIIKGASPGKTIAFRADFDALPIQDEKRFPINLRLMVPCMPAVMTVIRLPCWGWQRYLVVSSMI